MKIKEELEYVSVIIIVLTFIALFIFCVYWGIKAFVYVVTYQPNQIKKYEYIDLDNNTGIANECYTALSYPHCYIDNGTVIAVKQHKEIWVPNPDKEK